MPPRLYEPTTSLPRYLPHNSRGAACQCLPKNCKSLPFRPPTRALPRREYQPPQLQMHGHVVRLPPGLIAAASFMFIYTHHQACFKFSLAPLFASTKLNYEALETSNKFSMRINASHITTPNKNTASYVASV